MQFKNYNPPKSSFLSMEKDLSIILDKILDNNRLKKLLYYTTKNALDKPNLTEEESLSLVGKNIKIVPKLFVDPDVMNYLIITFEDFARNGENPEFRDNNIIFTIVCHMDQIQLQDLKLRPYRIAAELDTMFNNKHLTGIGTVQFSVASHMVVVNEEYVALRLVYSTIHGGEDQVRPLNPEDNFSND